VLHILPLGEELSRLQTMPSFEYRFRSYHLYSSPYLYYIVLQKAMHYAAVHGSLPRKHFFNICSSYTGTSAPRHFVILYGTGIHPDSVYGAALRRVCGASCIQLRGSGSRRRSSCSSASRPRAADIRTSLNTLPPPWNQLLPQARRRRLVTPRQQG